MIFLIVIKLKKDRCNPSQKNKYSSREIEGLIDKKASPIKKRLNVAFFVA